MTESSEEDSPPLIGVINEGTNTASFVLINSETLEEVASHSIRITQIHPHEGWQEQDPKEIIDVVRRCISETLLKMKDISRIKTIGITNQRETTILWDSSTGQPLYNAIVWSDIRTASLVDVVLAKVPDNDKNALKPICGLPISTLFSALKIRWMIENVPEVRKAIREQTCKFGTVDSWIIWNLTGGVKGGLHITDVTNASRTMLMNIESLQWDSVLCRYMQVPMGILPDIRSSSEIYGYIAEDELKDIPISGINHGSKTVDDSLRKVHSWKFDSSPYHDAESLSCIVSEIFSWLLNKHVTKHAASCWIFCNSPIIPPATEPSLTSNIQDYVLPK